MSDIEKRGRNKKFFDCKNDNKKKINIFGLKKWLGEKNGRKNDLVKKTKIMNIFRLLKWLSEKNGKNEYFWVVKCF